MMNKKYGPLMSDEEFYNSLCSDIPEIDHCVKLFRDGKSDDADAAFFDYIRSNLDRKNILTLYSHIMRGNGFCERKFFSFTKRSDIT